MFKMNINQTLEVKNSSGKPHLLFCLILTQTPWCSYFDAHLHEELRLQ